MQRKRMLSKILMILMTTALVLGAIAPAATVSLAAPAGPRLWQQKAGSAYTPIASDGNLWRSVTLPRADKVESMLRDNGDLPLNASPEAVQQAVSAW